MPSVGVSIVCSATDCPIPRFAIRIRFLMLHELLLKLYSKDSPVWHILRLIWFTDIYHYIPLINNCLLVDIRPCEKHNYPISLCISE